jgi:hypothetical protein
MNWNYSLLVELSAEASRGIVLQIISRAEFILCAMTFSHDGLRDSLTHLAAPPYFYENLRRDLATAQRNRSKLTLIRFQMFPTPESAVEAEGDENPHTRSLYEVAILSFAELLKSSIRAKIFVLD